MGARLRVTKIIVGIPSKDHVDFRNGVKQMVRACVCNVIQVPSMQRKLAKETWALLLIRLAYMSAECASNINWIGPGRFAEARRCTATFSLVLFKLFKGLSARKKEKQEEYLKECSWASFPVPSREWLTARYGESVRSSFSDSSKDSDFEMWKNITEKVSTDFTEKRSAATTAAAPTKVRRGMGSRFPLEVEYDREE